MRVAGPHVDLGYRIAAAILIFGGGGAWLDRRFGTEPWISIGGMLLSFVAILGIIMRFTIEADQEKQREEERKARRAENRGAGQDAGRDAGRGREGSSPGRKSD